MESIGIGGATERADRKAKQAGSRLSEMFVVASRLRSVIAGVSPIARPIVSGDEQSEWALVPHVTVNDGSVTLDKWRARFCQTSLLRPRCGHLPRATRAVGSPPAARESLSLRGVFSALREPFELCLGLEPVGLRLGDHPRQFGAPLERVRKGCALAAK